MEPALPPSSDITALLAAARGGGVSAQDELVAAVYQELRRLAQGRLRGDRAAATLGPTGLVHEAWLRLGLDRADFADRRHFFGAAARVMRQVLVDRHRQRQRHKRGAAFRHDEAVEVLAATVALPALDLIQLDDALLALEKVDERMARIVQLRFFAGLSVEEVAETLDVSPRTVKREWSVARLWLLQRMKSATA